MDKQKSSIILASKSLARQNMLASAGVQFLAMPADIDEDQYKVSGTQNDMALDIAKHKALHIAQENPTSLVIGADQILVLDDEIFSKAKSKEEAHNKLKKLRGRTHSLISSVCIVRDHKVLWSCTDEAHLKMRDFDDLFLERYIEKAGQALTRSVGSYELESMGSWLFDRIEGDFFTILGMPLLPLLAYLNDHHGYFYD